MEPVPAIKPPTEIEEVATGSNASKFACKHDIAMLRTVNLLEPWAAAHGAVMSTWDAIAESLADASDFGLKNKKGPALKTRFEIIMNRFKKSEFQSLRKSGTVEEYEEREQLLTDIKARMDDHTANGTVRKDAEKKKQEDLLMRRLNMAPLAPPRAEMTADSDASASSSVTAEAASESSEGPAATGEASTPSPKRLKKTIAKDDDITGLMTAIQSDISERRSRDEASSKQAQAELQLQRDRLDHDSTLARTLAEQNAQTQQIIMALLQQLADASSKRAQEELQLQRERLDHDRAVVRTLAEQNAQNQQIIMALLQQLADK
ncbi:hypothetical protein SPRG_14160 [Saprolegnia parasitica CBS 223.65]|uniref:Uncharacterized protein n=1 Tax=Saprolegnia parasitica (strain CBS 223.65) TaxID=695850 RepID=A0A067BZK0_SAPPC|nr:hypothetical protein SPRG_14160 [Saprolegnia parasitica CBS 223.65]KDO20012.1 hypothetical protein SPRG_14160 [Saprolegnia parasitica CBS 223.65]|eukprot:XP_012209248.1 hypothetical protein SPRG_14160 [Saprolegnia parasitica CBS 223.65]